MMDEALPKADSVQFVMKCYTKLIISRGWNMKLDIFDLSGKVAVVTGGNSGIGRAIAGGLAEAGASIVICARRFKLCQETCCEIEKLGVRAVPIRCDVTDASEVDNMIGTAVKEFGRVDILVNNAGVGESGKPVTEMSDADWDRVMNINARGVFLCSRAAAKEMMNQNSGKIINIASICSFIVMDDSAEYCASKGAVLQLTKALALELARYNIQVNSIAPGFIDTPMTHQYLATQEGKRDIRNTPMKRPGQANELKGAAIYLASPASSFTTGSCILVDGGYMLT
jgi:gluconate 5-dehydrogenase